MSFPGKCFVERYVRANKQLQSCEKETADILCSAGLSSDQLPSLVQKIEKEERTRLTQCQEPIGTCQCNSIRNMLVLCRFSYSVIRLRAISPTVAYRLC